MSHNKLDRCPKCGYNIENGQGLGGHIAHCNGEHPDQIETRVKKLKEDGLSKDQIARELGMSKRAVRRRLE